MGQQQILLLLLVTIIVGIATIVGINIFRGEEVYFEEEAYTQMMLETAEQAQAWYLKPTGIGGGGGSFTGLDFNQIPCPSDMIVTGAGSCQSQEGYLFGFSSVSSDSVVLQADLLINGQVYEAQLSVHPKRVNWIERWDE